MAVDGWTALETELDAWAATDRRADLWWRDDDAETPSRELDRLLTLQAAVGLPLALAVIPAGAGPALAERLTAHDGEVAVLQHGYRHQNHAAPGEKKSEFPDRRVVHDMLADVALGREGLKVLFPARFLPVFVPPWNRLCPAMLPRLKNAFVQGYSAYGPAPDLSGENLTACNTHMDPIDWRGGGGFAGEDAALTAIVDGLRDRRVSGSAEPLGILTHHLQQDEAVWQFLERFLTFSSGHAGAHWRPTAEIFNVSP